MPVNLTIGKGQLKALSKEITKKMLNAVQQQFIPEVQHDMYGMAESLVANGTINDFDFGNYYGLLKARLEASGLDRAGNTNPGRLKEGFFNTIRNIKVDQRKTNSISFNLFNDRILDESTPWVGVSPKPIERKFLDQATKEWTVKIVNKVQPTLNHGFRPLAGKMKWYANPYPGKGYWLLYEQGWIGSGYESRDYIKQTYDVVFDNAFKLLGDGKSLKFKPKYTNKLANIITEYVNAN